MMLNDLNLDLLNINVYTKFGQILSIHSQDIEWKQTSDINDVTLLQMLDNPNLDLVNINVYTNFGIVHSCSQDIEWKRNLDNNQGP